MYNVCDVVDVTLPGSDVENLQCQKKKMLAGKILETPLKPGPGDFIFVVHNYIKSVISQMLFSKATWGSRTLEMWTGGAKPNLRLMAGHVDYSRPHPSYQS